MSFHAKRKILTRDRLQRNRFAISSFQIASVPLKPIFKQPDEISLKGNSMGYESRSKCDLWERLSYVVNSKVCFAEFPDRFAEFQMIKARESFQFTMDYKKCFDSKMILLIPRRYRPACLINTFEQTSLSSKKRSQNVVNSFSENQFFKTNAASFLPFANFCFKIRGISTLRSPFLTPGWWYQAAYSVQANIFYSSIYFDHIGSDYMVFQENPELTHIELHRIHSQ